MVFNQRIDADELKNMHGRVNDLLKEGYQPTIYDKGMLESLQATTQLHIKDGLPADFALGVYDIRKQAFSDARKGLTREHNRREYEGGSEFNQKVQDYHRNGLPENFWDKNSEWSKGRVASPDASSSSKPPASGNISDPSQQSSVTPSNRQAMMQFTGAPASAGSARVISETAPVAAAPVSPDIVDAAANRSSAPLPPVGYVNMGYGFGGDGRSNFMGAWPQHPGLGMNGIPGPGNMMNILAAGAAFSTVTNMLPGSVRDFVGRYAQQGFAGNGVMGIVGPNCNSGLSLAIPSLANRVTYYDPAGNVIGVPGMGGPRMQQPGQRDPIREQYGMRTPGLDTPDF